MPSIQYLRDLTEIVELHPYACFAIAFTAFIWLALIVQSIAHLITTIAASIRIHLYKQELSNNVDAKGPACTRCGNSLDFGACKNRNCNYFEQD